MKAFVLHGINEYRIEEAAMPSLAEDEVLIRVKAAGICGSDIPRIYQTGAHVHPLIPGHEFAGEVAEIGEHVDASWKNQRVGVYPLIPCGACIPCQNHQYEMCRNYSYLGSRRNGGFAEYVAVPQKNLLRLPENVEYEEAAMMEPMAVAVHAMRRVQVRQEDAVVVCGLGTIGMLLVMLLCEAGVRNIYVIGNKELQKRHMLRLGISEEHYCDSRREQVDKWLVEHVDKIDVFFECVGKNETIAWAVDAVAPGGRICLVGNPYGDVRLTKEVYWKILRNQLMITGTWNSSFTMEDTDDWWYVLKRLEEHRIHPAEFVSHRYDLEHIEDGLLIMRDKTEEYGKIMVSGLDLNNRT